MSESDIKTNHKNLHDSISEDYYKNKLMSKEDFDYYHGQNWADMEDELIAGGYKKLPEPPRDLGAEIDELREVNIELKAEMGKLKEARNGT